MANKVEIQPVTLFATPDSMEAMQAYIEKIKDPLATTAAMMMYNFFASNFDLYEKEQNND